MKTKFYLRKVHLSYDGYTSEGYYFGRGLPLWQAVNDGSLDDMGKTIVGSSESAYNRNVVAYARGKYRDDAKREIRRQIPGAEFHR